MDPLKIVQTRQNETAVPANAAVYKSITDVTTLFYVASQNPEEKKEGGKYKFEKVGDTATHDCAGYRTVRVTVYLRGESEEKELHKKGRQPDGSQALGAGTELAFLTLDASLGTGGDAQGAWAQAQLGVTQPNALSEFAQNATAFIENLQKTLAAVQVIVTAGETLAKAYVNVAAAAARAIITTVQEFLDTLKLTLKMQMFDVPHNFFKRLPPVDAARKKMVVDKFKSFDWTGGSVNVLGGTEGGTEGGTVLTASTPGDMSWYALYPGGNAGLLQQLVKTINDPRYDGPPLPKGATVAGVSLVVGSNSPYDSVAAVAKLWAAIQKLFGVAGVKAAYSNFDLSNAPNGLTARNLRTIYLPKAGASYEYGTSAPKKTDSGSFSLRWEDAITGPFYPHIGGRVTFPTRSGVISGHLAYEGPPEQLGIWVTAIPEARYTDPETGSYTAKWVSVFEKNAKYARKYVRIHERRSKDSKYYRKPEDLYDTVVDLNDVTYVYDLPIKWLQEICPHPDFDAQDVKALEWGVCIKLRHDSETVVLVTDTDAKDYYVGTGYLDNAYAYYRTAYTDLRKAPASGVSPAALLPKWEGWDFDSGLGKQFSYVSKSLLSYVADYAKAADETITWLADSIRALIKDLDNLAAQCLELAKTLKDLASFNAGAYVRAFQYAGNSDTFLGFTGDSTKTLPTGKQALLQEYNTSIPLLPFKGQNDFCFGIFIVLDTVALGPYFSRAFQLLCSLLGIKPPTENRGFGSFDPLFNQGAVFSQFGAALADAWRPPETTTGGVTDGPGATGIPDTGSQGSDLTFGGPPSRGGSGGGGMGPPVGSDEEEARANGNYLDWNCPPRNTEPVQRFTDDLRPILK